MEITKIVEKLNLIPHPEGGFYSETYRSEISIPGIDRQLMTSIYFLLTADNVSKFHRIKSDELWFFHSGSPLIVHTLDKKGHTQTIIGNDISNNENPQFLVKKDTIFGSSISSSNNYSLVSCVVSPGFDFKDFELFSYAELIELYPNNQEIILKLT